MKHFYIFLAFLIAFLGTISAQTSPIMVCNPAGTICEPYYNFNLDTAITYANNGDYIYLSGGNYVISDTIKKEIHIYGTGIVTDSTIYIGGVTTINSNIVFSPLSSNSSVTGVITNTITLESPSNSLNFDLTRSKLNGLYINTLGGNIYIAQNIITSGIRGNSVFNANVLIANNIIPQGGITSTTSAFGCYNQPWYNTGAGIGYLNGATIKNNVIFPTSTTNFGYTYTECGYNSDCGGYYLFIIVCYTEITNCLLKNNIFRSTNGMTGVYSSNNVFTNNLITPTGYFGFQPNITFSGASSQSFNKVDSTVNHTFNSLLNCDNGNQVGMAYQFKLELKPTSLGHNAGDDGTDVGIFGGTLPWKAGAVPSNPHIYYKLINGSTDVNGNLPINIKIRGEN